MTTPTPTLWLLRGNMHLWPDSLDLPDPVGAWLAQRALRGAYTRYRDVLPAAEVRVELVATAAVLEAVCRDPATVGFVFVGHGTDQSLRAADGVYVTSAQMAGWLGRPLAAAVLLACHTADTPNWRQCLVTDGLFVGFRGQILLTHVNARRHTRRVEYVGRDGDRVR